MTRLTGLIVIVLAALFGCSTAPAAPTVTPLLPTTATPVVEATAEASTVEAASLPVWLTTPLTDVRTGAQFTLADYMGKTVLVHPFAVWCTNCRSDHRKLRDEVIPTLDPNKFAFVSLNVEANEPDDRVAAYADNENFDWTFATTPPEMLEALIGQFGSSVNVPPVRPRFFLRPDGTVTELSTGEMSAAAYLDLLNQLSTGNA